MNAIELENACFRRGGRDILASLCWSVPAGSVAAILGPNGCGKTTLLRLITGYAFPTRGTIRCLGERLGRVDVHSLRRRIGIVDPTNPFRTEGRVTVRDVVVSGYFGTLTIDYDSPTQEQFAMAEAALDQVGLGDRQQQRFGTLSTGEQRRALLARALVDQPEMLLLDEPTAGLDLLARETMLATVERLRQIHPCMTVMMVTHHLEELSPSTSEVLLLAQGRGEASGEPHDVLQSDAVSRAFGCPVDVRQTNGRWTWRVDPQTWNSLL